MQPVVPDYYDEFACLKGACRHSCCIGWEIDIDEDTLGFYRSISSPFGDRLISAVSEDGEPHFILDKHERCPFLNRDGLCDIILTLGEEALCDICSDHPRFRNELPDRVEIGLGLCCEAAGRLILGRSKPMTLLGVIETEDEILLLRERVLAVLQDRTFTVGQRLDAMLAMCKAESPFADMGFWADRLLALERLDEQWTQLLLLLRERWKQVDLAAFERAMAERETEYEQFSVYLLYRHFANASDADDAACRAAFVAWGTQLLVSLGAVLYAQNGSFDFEQQVELARLFSSEIEYSDENLDLLLESFRYKKGR